MQTNNHTLIAIFALVLALFFAVAEGEASSSIQLSAERSELTSTKGLTGLIARIGWPCEMVRKVSVLIEGEVFRVRCTGLFEDYVIEANESDVVITRVVD